MHLRCTSPRTVGFSSDGKTIVWSEKLYSKEYPPFQLPCGKCIECRLEYARHWAVRCVHEAQMHEKNCFVTLTYSDENLKSAKLVYSDFQKFMKKLRKLQDDPIGLFVTGEYGEQTKRPHWHALLFNWEPKDPIKQYTNHRGDPVFTSEILTKTWGLGNCNYGSVTFESAGYVARYAAKKLVHGKDGHEYQPISKKSSKNAIGKSWLEKYWPDIFNYGELEIEGKTVGSIPRYYLKWFQQHRPLEYQYYVTQTKQKIIDRAKDRSDNEQQQWWEENSKRLDEGKWTFTPTEKKRRAIIIKQKFNQLQSYLKLK